MRPAGRPFLADETQGLAFVELVPWNIYSFASNPAKPPLIKGGLRAFSPPLIRGDGGGGLKYYRVPGRRAGGMDVKFC